MGAGTRSGDAGLVRRGRCGSGRRRVVAAAARKWVGPFEKAQPVAGIGDRHSAGGGLDDELRPAAFRDLRSSTRSHLPGRLGRRDVVVRNRPSKLNRTWNRNQNPTGSLSPREFAREILETLPDGLLLLRADDRIRAANETMGELAGCPAHELMGLPIAELLCDPPQREGREFECELIRTDDARMPVSLSNVALCDDSGEPVGSVLVVRDLREVTSLRSRLVTAGRLAAVGQLASGIAHEINNPTAYVRSNVNLLRQHWEGVRAVFDKTRRGSALRTVLDNGDELLDETTDGIDRIAAIVRDVGGLRDAGEAAETEVADVNRLLDAALRISAAQIRGRIEIERRYEEVPMVRCRSQELMQVFLNLLLNACHALESGGIILVATHAESDLTTVTIEDNGPGIASDDRDRIFEPFYTTKPVGVGTGLGLAISKQIVEKHGGQISVSSEPGRGARFQVSLRSDVQPGGTTASRRRDGRGCLSDRRRSRGGHDGQLDPGPRPGSACQPARRTRARLFGALVALRIAVEPQRPIRSSCCGWSASPERGGYGWPLSCSRSMWNSRAMRGRPSAS